MPTVRLRNLRRIRQLACAAGITFVGLAASALAAEGESRSARTREFRFDYGATVNGLSPGERAQIWLPVPPSNLHQEVELLAANLPAEGTESTEPKYGNRILHFEAAADESGRIRFNQRYRVLRREARGLDSAAPDKLPQPHREMFLLPNRRVPVAGKPLTLLEGHDLPTDEMRLARKLYDVVDDHVVYDKSRPGYGNGDSTWVCDSRFGNCTDFHSLFISLARSRNLPARFEIGFPLPAQRGAGEITGYHCWAHCFVQGQGWIPVDISEADKHPEQKEYYFGNLTENRVAFSVGRDIQLVPKQGGPALNYFVYPHVEVGGHPWAKENIRLQFSYVDL